MVPRATSSSSSRLEKTLIMCSGNTMYLMPTACQVISRFFLAFPGSPSPSPSPSAAAPASPVPRPMRTGVLMRPGARLLRLGTRPVPVASLPGPACQRLARAAIFPALTGRPAQSVIWPPAIHRPADPSIAERYLLSRVAFRTNRASVVRPDRSATWPRRPPSGPPARPPAIQYSACHLAAPPTARPCHPPSVDPLRC